MRITAEDFVGNKFGMLFGIRMFRVGSVPKVECRCDCGNVKIVNAYDLNRGGVKSCGCLRAATFNKLHTKHGHATGPSRTKEYQAWRGMLARCNYERFAKYYLSRGITVSPEWADSFINFLAHVGPAPSPRHSLDRIDNDLGYWPGNVRWATSQEQARNRSNGVYVSVDGSRMLLVDAAEKHSIDAKVVRNRLANGWPEEAAIKTPQNTASRPLERRS